MSQSLIFRKKYFLLLGTVMGLTFSSFYYFFLIQVLSFLFFVIYKLRFNFISDTIKNIKCIIIFLISFLIVSAPFIWVLIHHEKDLTIGAGVFDLDYQKKLILIKYLLSKIFTIKFIIFNLVIVIYSVYLNVKKTPNYKILNIFNIVYISSIIAPFLFLILSNKASILYHFNNNIVIFGFLSLLIAIIISFKNLINFFSKKLFIYIFLFCIFGIYLKSELNNKKNVNLTRIEFNKITKIIKNKNHNNYYNSILTFDDQFMIWSVLNRKIEYLSLTYAGLTPKSFDLIENDLIHVFKFLNLNSHDWLKFLENKKNSWKYFNSQVADFFSLRYMANSLNTYNDSLNFPEDTKNFILKTSPIYNQQLAIPNEEFSRLKNKFIKNKDEILFKPKIIILNNDLSFMHKIDIKESEYCKIFQGQIFTLFLIVSENLICEQTM